MTKKKCPKCGESISSDNKFCPSCGHPFGQKAGKTQTSRSNHYIILGILVIVIVAYMGYQAISTDPEGGEGQMRPQGTASMSVNMEDFANNLPTDFESLVSMGNALMDQGQYQMAMECYSRALDQKTEDVDVWVDYGACQHALGLDQQAISSFEKALEFDPSHQIAKFNMGIVYYTAGNGDQAIEWWERLLSEDPPQEIKDRVAELIYQVEENY